MRIDSRTELACAFPPSRGLNGALTSVADLQWCFSRRNRIFCESKREAVRLIVAANFSGGPDRAYTAGSPSVWKAESGSDERTRRPTDNPS